MAQPAVQQTVTMNPASASHLLAAYGRRSRHAATVGALASLLTVVGWIASLAVSSWLSHPGVRGVSRAVLDPSHGVPMSMRVLAPATLALALCAWLARRLGGARAARVVWVTATALAPLAFAGVAAELHDWWVVDFVMDCVGHTRLDHGCTSYERWFEGVSRALRSVMQFDLRAARFVAYAYGLSYVDALAVAGGGVVVTVWSLRRRVGLRVDRLVRHARVVALTLLVTSGARMLVQPQTSGYVRGLPVVAVLPSIGDPANDPRARPSYGLDDREDVVPDHRHLVERPPVRYVGRDTDEPAPYVVVDDRWGDLVLRRECDGVGFCTLYWRRGREAMWSNGAFSRKGEPQFGFGLREPLTVRHDARRRIAYVTSATRTVAAIRLDEGPRPLDEVRSAELDLVPWRELSRDVAPPWPYVALAAAGWIAATLRRRPRALRVDAVSASAYRTDAAPTARLDDDVARWNTPRLEADALGRLACIALTHAPLVAVWLTG